MQGVVSYKINAALLFSICGISRDYLRRGGVEASEEGEGHRNVSVTGH